MSSKNRASRPGGSSPKKHTKSQRPAKRAPPTEAQKPVDAPPPAPREPQPEDVEDVADTPSLPEPEPSPTPAEPPSFTPAPPVPEPVPATASKPVTAPGATMSPEPSPPPAPATAPTPQPAPAPPPQPAPQWVPVGNPPSPEAATPRATDAWLQRATVRRGLPILQAVGWVVTLVGFLLLVAAYYQAYRTDAIPAPAGIRLDYIAALLVFIGLATAITFAFVPPRSATGVTAEMTAQELEARASSAHQRVRTAQVLVGVGLGVMLIGLLWLFYWVRVGFLDGALRDSVVANYAVPTHYFGAILLLLGALIVFGFWGRVGAARNERAMAVMAWQRAAAPSAPAAMSAVSDAELQALMRRLDGLMAQLPDAAVTEFSKTPEADTYLKLLGS